MGLSAGCASISVKKVEPGKASVGLRYSLPKPFIQVVPQADGTVAVDVIYLPDTQNTYAINTWSFMSSYVYQVSLDQNGLLNAVEFKQNTSVVGQQVAATGGAVAAQAVNTRNAQLIAAQTLVDSAQTAVDNARSMRDQAQSKFNLLKANVPANSPDLLNAQIALSQAQAQLTDAEQNLSRARTSARAATTAVNTGTPVQSATLSPSSAGFGMPSWTQPPVYSISGSRGAVLFAIDDTIDAKTKQNAVKLRAQKIDPSDVGAQHEFRTTSIAGGSASLKPQDFGFTAGGTAVFFFSQNVAKISDQNLQTVAAPPKNVTSPPLAKLMADGRQVQLPLTNLAKGHYRLSVVFDYPDMRKGLADVTFSVE